jgi:hypothetical protein
MGILWEGVDEVQFDQHPDCCPTVALCACGGTGSYEDVRGEWVDCPYHAGCDCGLPHRALPPAHKRRILIADLADVALLISVAVTVVLVIAWLVS